MRPFSLPALPLTRIISNSTHIPTLGHGLGPSKTPRLEVSFALSRAGLSGAPWWLMRVWQ